MVTIHNKDSTNFIGFGIGSLMPVSCTIEEELNGMYELEMIHPYDEYSKWKRIEKDLILSVPTPNGYQAFRIYKVTPTLKNITVYAKHIFYDLADNLVQSLDTTGTAMQVLSAIESNFNFPMSFNFSTDITTTKTITAENENPVFLLLGEDDEKTTFHNTFRGEISRDNFNISMLERVGEDRGVQIRYSKNLIGMEIEEDLSELATKIKPIGYDGLTLPETYINSPYIFDYSHPRIFIHNDSDAETTTELRQSALDLLANGADIPKVNIKVDFKLLKKTEEYKDFAVLEDVRMGDTVTVINQKIGFKSSAEVIKYEWDCIWEKYNSVELGNFVANITHSVSVGEKSFGVATNANTIAYTADTTANEALKSLEYISGNVTIRDNYLYVCIDNSNYLLATKLFRFGTTGLQHSDTGINGTWSTVIDVDGNVL